jgi:hypothetical protein
MLAADTLKTFLRVVLRWYPASGGRSLSSVIRSARGDVTGKARFFLKLIHVNNNYVYCLGCRFFDQSSVWVATYEESHFADEPVFGPIIRVIK